MDSIPEKSVSEDLFIAEVPDYLNCIICTKILRNPVQILSCGHKFCEVCFEQVLKRAEDTSSELLCPIDRNIVDVADVRPDVAMKRIVGNLLVKCAHFERGCSWTGDLNSFAGHVEKCEHRKPDLLVEVNRLKEIVQQNEKDQEYIWQQCEDEIDALQKENQRLQNVVSQMKNEREEQDMRINELMMRVDRVEKFTGKHNRVLRQNGFSSPASFPPQMDSGMNGPVPMMNGPGPMLNGPGPMMNGPGPMNGSRPMNGPGPYCHWTSPAVPPQTYQSAPPPSYFTPMGPVAEKLFPPLKSTQSSSAPPAANKQVAPQKSLPSSKTSVTAPAAAKKTLPTSKSPTDVDSKTEATTPAVVKKLFSPTAETSRELPSFPVSSLSLSPIPKAAVAKKRAAPRKSVPPANTTKATAPAAKKRRGAGKSS